MDPNKRDMEQWLKSQKLKDAPGPALDRFTDEVMERIQHKPWWQRALAWSPEFSLPKLAFPVGAGALAVLALVTVVYWTQPASQTGELRTFQLAKTASLPIEDELVLLDSIDESGTTVDDILLEA